MGVQRLDQDPVEIADVGDGLSPRFYDRRCHGGRPGGERLVPGRANVVRDEADFDARGLLRGVVAAVTAGDECAGQGIGGERQGRRPGRQLTVGFVVANETPRESKCALIEIDRPGHVRDVDDRIAEPHDASLPPWNKCSARGCNSTTRREVGRSVKEPDTLRGCL